MVSRSASVNTSKDNEQTTAGRRALTVPWLPCRKFSQKNSVFGHKLAHSIYLRNAADVTLISLGKIFTCNNFFFNNLKMVETNYFLFSNWPFLTSKVPVIILTQKKTQAVTDLVVILFNLKVTKSGVKKSHGFFGFAMHHFRSGFSVVVTDVWTRSLLTPVSWFHYQIAATLCLFFYCYKWLLRAPSSSGKFKWRATFINFLSTLHKLSRVPQDAARNAAPQSTSSWTAFLHTF